MVTRQSYTDPNRNSRQNRRRRTSQSVMRSRTAPGRNRSLFYLGGVWVVWLLLISGILSDFTNTPGVLQYVRLNQLVEKKESELATLEERAVSLEQKKKAFENDPMTVEAEIRRVLGYVGKNEIIFDFSRPE